MKLIELYQCNDSSLKKMKAILKGRESQNEYTENNIIALEMEIKLANTPLSKKLRHTEVILYKAVHPIPEADCRDSNSMEISRYITSLNDNNIGNICKEI